MLHILQAFFNVVILLRVNRSNGLRLVHPLFCKTQEKQQRNMGKVRVQTQEQRQQRHQLSVMQLTFN